jgi:hypothetical protein
MTVETAKVILVISALILTAGNVLVIICWIIRKLMGYDSDKE